MPWERIREPRNACALVFIHGLFSDMRECWQNGTAFWPDLIGDEAGLGEYGIYLFGYDTGVSPGNYSISDAADALFANMKNDKLIGLRQIIFIGHSMGGIVARRLAVKRALEFTKRQTSLGFFLVASPSLGSDYANLFRLLIRLNNLQIDQLRFTQTNTWLSDLDRDFIDLKESRAFPIFGQELIEADPVKLPRMFFGSQQIVIPASAARYFGNALKIARSDHVSIAKPRDREAQQHRELVGFILDHAPGAAADRPAAVGAVPAAGVRDPLELDPLVAAAIGARRLGVQRMPPPDAPASEVFAHVRPFADGALMQRRYAALVVRRSGQPEAVFRAALAVAGGLPANEGQRIAELAATWLRFWPEREWTPGQPDLVAEAIAALNPGKADAMRLRLRILGALGEGVRLPRLDWDDEWTRDKFGLAAFRATIQTAALSTSPAEIASQIGDAAAIATALAAHDDALSLLDHLAAFNALKPSHLAIALDRARRDDAPGPMLAGLLARLSVAPNRQAMASTMALVSSPQHLVAQWARIALAFLPGKTQEAERVLGPPGLRDATLDIGGIVASGVEPWPLAVPLLAQDLAERSGGERYAAAWALGRLARSVPAARDALDRAARENGDELVRAMLLAGRAVFDPIGAGPGIERELPDALGLPRFVLLIGQSYVTDACALFAHLVETSESELYIPYLAPWLQVMVRDAAAHAAGSAPALAELLAIGDAA